MRSWPGGSAGRWRGWPARPADLLMGDRSSRVQPAGPREQAAVAAAFNTMADSLVAQERQRTELVANFAHELRTRLTNLRGYLEAMRDGVMEPSPELFDSLREEVRRLERLSGGLDALSGDGMGVDGARPVILDLSAAISAAVELAKPGFEHGGLRLQVEVPASGQLCALAVPEPDPGQPAPERSPLHTT